MHPWRNRVTDASDFNQPLHKSVGLILGPTIFVIMLFSDAQQNFMSSAAWRTSAVGMWMAIWWATEAVDVAITALLPLVTFDLMGISSIKEAAAPYAHEDPACPAFSTLVS